MALMARYSGECPACGERWQPGDLIRADEDRQWKHAVCPEPTPEPVAVVCPGCFLELPASGVCGVCHD